MLRLDPRSADLSCVFFSTLQRLELQNESRTRRSKSSAHQPTNTGTHPCMSKTPGRSGCTKQLVLFIALVLDMGGEAD